LTSGFVCIMGIGTVFVGLICLIVLCTIMSKICKVLEGAVKQPAAPAAAQAAAPAPAAVPVNAEIPNRQQFVAAVSAAIAEDMGTDVSGIRIVSIKRV